MSYDTIDWWERQTVRPEQVAEPERPRRVRLTGQAPLGPPELWWAIEGDEYPVEGWATTGNRPIVRGIALHDCEWVASDG